VNETWWVSKEQLTPEQSKVIDLPLAGSYLILGPPGSGKTNLLLLRANYLHLAGHPGLVLIVFTRALQEFLRAGAEQYDFPSQKIVTSTRWMSALLREYGRVVPDVEKFELLRQELISAVRELIKAKNLSNIYDAILLDEAQDYLPEELEIFRRLCKRLYVVADSRQKIYRGSDSISPAEQMVDKVLVLTHHFRNGLKICRLADEIGNDSLDYQPMEGTAQYKETIKPSSVEHHSCPSMAEQIAKILEKLDVQRQTYPDELIGICCPRNEDAEAVWAAILASPFASVSVLQKSNEHTAFAAGVRVCVSTIHAAKGLEFRALHLAGLERLSSFEFARNIAFTAVTRAKTSLSLYYDDNIPSFLESALSKLQPLPELPSASAAFGKAKGK
jgi:superfamily I DNA/RNA helicase